MLVYRFMITSKMIQNVDPHHSPHAPLLILLIYSDHPGEEQSSRRKVWSQKRDSAAKELKRLPRAQRRAGPSAFHYVYICIYYVYTCDIDIDISIDIDTDIDIDMFCCIYSCMDISVA